MYYGYKNLSTYLSYTAGTKRAAEASADGRAAASSWVPGFCVTQALNTKDSRFPQVMNKCLHVKSFGESTVAMQTHTQTYLHCLKSIDFLEIDPRVYLSNLHY